MALKIEKRLREVPRVGVPEANGNVQAFLGAGAKPAHVTKAMYQQIEKKLM